MLDKLLTMEEDARKFDNLITDSVKDLWDQHSEIYEKVYLTVEWPDPKMCADRFDMFNIPKDAEILDMGCGTGLVAEYLTEMGYSKIYGVDASPGMMEKAKQKNLYTDIEELYLGQPDTFPEKYHNRFDAITCSGVIVEGLCGPKIFHEMILALKVGGYAIFSTRYDYIDEKCQPTMDKLVEEGKWELVERSNWIRYGKY